MIKVKFFFGNIQNSVKNWLYENQKIDILSTNLTSNEHDTIYSILYKEKDNNNG